MIRPSRAFTLVELLVVIAILGILAALLLPALSGAKAKASQLACLGNYRQLQLAWHMYVDDNHGLLPPNATRTGSGREGFVATTQTWVQGNAFTDTTSSNIEHGVLFPYDREVRIYKCPADRSTVRDERRIKRHRSVSMNSYLNDDPNPLSRACWHRLDQVLDPPPERVFVFIDEHENSIENARFVSTQPGVPLWIDFPAVRHRGGCTLTFADGHAEAWRWREPNTLRIGKLNTYIQSQSALSPTDRDLARIHAGVPRVPLAF